MFSPVFHKTTLTPHIRRERANTQNLKNMRTLARPTQSTVNNDSFSNTARIEISRFLSVVLKRKKTRHDDDSSIVLLLMLVSCYCYCFMLMFLCYCYCDLFLFPFPFYYCYCFSFCIRQETLNSYYKLEPHDNVEQALADCIDESVEAKDDGTTVILFYI